MDSLALRCPHSDIRTFNGISCCLVCGSFNFESPSNPDSDFGILEAIQYLYETLNAALGQEIRLVHIYPEREADELYCDIIHVNLFDHPKYEALSYTWATYTWAYPEGDATPLKRIFCQGKYIPITSNCELAIRRLRQPVGKRIVWIDALCINQSDVRERNHQVSLMKQIYSSSVQTVVYLGEPYWTSDRAIAFFEGSNLENVMWQYMDVTESELPFTMRSAKMIVPSIPGIAIAIAKCERTEVRECTCYPPLKSHN